MIRPITLAVMVAALQISAGCNKWIGMSTEKKPLKTPENPSRPAPDGNPVSNDSVAKGHIRITVKLLKSENEAWFKNCLSFQVSGDVTQTVRVGCNKQQSGERFLQQDVPYDFEVTRGGQVGVDFTFETWKSESNCITYNGSCANPYPGQPMQRHITGPVPAIRCYRAGSQAFRLFYEDQPDENHAADARIRSKLRQEASEEAPAAFDPAAPVSLDTRYRKRADMPLNTADPQEACVAQASPGDFVSERQLQDCLGIDHRDFVVEVESADASIRIGDFTDDRCHIL